MSYFELVHGKKVRSSRISVMFQALPDAFGQFNCMVRIR